MLLCSSYAFDAFCNRWSFLVKDLASAVRTLHSDVLHIELDCFLTQTTFIPGHFDSSSTGDSTGSPLRIRSAVTPEGVVGRYAPPAKTLPHFEHSQILGACALDRFLTTPEDMHDGVSAGFRPHGSWFVISHHTVLQSDQRCQLSSFVLTYYFPILSLSFFRISCPLSRAPFITFCISSFEKLPESPFCIARISPL